MSKYARRASNKYGVSAAEDRTADGIVFHSKREMLTYVGFKLILDNGKIGKLELQVPFPLYASTPDTDRSWLPKPVAKYVADFVVTELDGTRRIYDSKGVSTPMFKLKMKIFAANYPNLRVVTI